MGAQGDSRKLWQTYTNMAPSGNSALPGNALFGAGF
jgi:hypothetical protein